MLKVILAILIALLPMSATWSAVGEHCGVPVTVSCGCCGPDNCCCEIQPGEPREPLPTAPTPASPTRILTPALLPVPFALNLTGSVLTFPTNAFSSASILRVSATEYRSVICIWLT